MNSLAHLREVVDVVIGVDTHVHTHCAAVVDAAAGGVLAEITVEATAEGDAELVEFADNHATDRQLNNALHTVVQSPIQYQPTTRDYVARRTAEGKTSREIKRCLARYVARDLYRLLEIGAAAA